MAPPCSWKDTFRSMRPSKEDAEPAKITQDGTPTIFSFLTSTMEEAAAGKAASGAAKELQKSFDSISLAGPESGAPPASARRCCSHPPLFRF